MMQPTLAAELSQELTQFVMFLHAIVKAGYLTGLIVIPVALLLNELRHYIMPKTESKKTEEL